MSVLTATPLKAAPSGAVGVTLTFGGAWTASTWVEVIAATAAPIAIAGVQFGGGSYSNQMWELDIGTGAGGAEVVLGTLRLFLFSTGSFVNPNGVFLPVPLGGIGAGVRVAVRQRTSGAQGPGRLTLNYYENFSSDQVSTSSQVLSCAPSGSTTANLTPSATPWVNSAWLPLIASAPTDLGLLGLTHYTHSSLATADGVEYDIGTGGSGSETVVTTVRQAFLQQAFVISWLPGMYPIVAGTRVSVRVRKAGTNTTAHPVALLYYTNVSAAPAAVATGTPFVWGPL